MLEFFRPSKHRRLRRHARRGSLIVWCSLLLVVLLGMVGLIIDGGMMLAAHRHAHNAADAAALAAAFDLLSGRTAGEAVSTGTTFVTSDDIRLVAHPVLRHRIITNFTAQAEGKESDDVIDELLKIVKES